jgi:cytochrome c oxidase subunit II
VGKLFAVIVAVIAAVSTTIFVLHVWWPPADISVLGIGIDHQLNETMIATGALFVTSQLALALFLWQGSDTRAGRTIKQFPGGATPLVLFAVVLVGIEILTLTFVGSKVWANIYIAPADSGSLHIDVQAEQFAYYFRYAGADARFGGLHPEMIDDGSGNFFGLDPANDTTARDDIVSSSLVVPVNRSILLTLHAKDVGHSFYVPDLRLQQDFVPGLIIPIHFTATHTGKYEIVCTQLCGLGHYNMRAFLEVMAPDQYDQWLKTQAAQQ